MQNHFEETTRMEAGIPESAIREWFMVLALSWIYCMLLLKGSSMKQLTMLFLKGIWGFKGLGSFSFQLLSGTILAPESQYSFAINKKTESVTISLF